MQDGDFAGRTAAWDGLNWSERGMQRVKYVLDKLGFDVDGELELQPDDLLGRQVLVSVLTEEREDPLTGIRQVRMRVPYMGYESVEVLNGGLPRPGELGR